MYRGDWNKTGYTLAFKLFIRISPKYEGIAGHDFSLTIQHLTLTACNVLYGQSNND